ncbi:nucleoside-diphosphate sugar epimerase/dehydratase [Hoylesella oralis]|uniref:polysaccharide biosynthesis protein n=1 Tax=Hoylesella oralis TaxID=28134 RepID=UPI0028E689F0|nr:nucleoside-diphosphate sugar epimerase/dehydratase [Hoylesella oralis]
MRFLNRLVNWYFKRESLPYWCILFIDSLICYVSGIFVCWLFFRGAATLDNILPITRTLLLYTIFNLLGFKFYHTYYGVIRYSSFVDLQRVGYAMGVGFICVAILHYPIIWWGGWNGWLIPLHFRHIVSIYIVATILMWAFRVIVKLVYDSAFDNEKAERTLIYGIKDGGIGLAKNAQNEKPQRFRVQGFISHEPSFKNHYLMGKKVYPVDDELTDVIGRGRIKAVLVSPLRNDEFRNDEKLQDILINAGVHIYMTDGAKEWNVRTESISKSTLKEINIEDLLPRDEIQVDMESVGRLLNGYRVLITGSAGSIGSEMVKQICKFRPAKLMLIDQAETPQHDIRLMMAHDYGEIETETIVASITNKERMEKIFSEFKPHYVFHAAAYKHVPMMENNPSESILNNIWGTKVIADLSVKYGVKKFVMVSTDKAVNPTNVMGCSKRICEIYVQSLDKAEKEGTVQGNTHFVTTRFGNVLGSNGSVIPLFEKQIKMGGPVTVTDPNIIRFFMLIPEACKLVLEAGTKGNGGEIFVFDMGKPVRIADLARRMIKLSGAQNVEISYTGLRAGEKLYEEVLNDKEGTLPSFNDKIRIAKVREYDYKDVEKEIEELFRIADTYNDMDIVRKMKEIVPEFTSKNSVYASLDEQHI